MRGEEDDSSNQLRAPKPMIIVSNHLLSPIVHYIHPYMYNLQQNITNGYSGIINVKIGSHCGSKKAHKMDTCFKTIGLCGQNLSSILGSIVNIV